MSTASSFDFEAVARAALAQAPSLLLQWFPAGKFRGHEFVIGDLSGARGESLSVNTTTGKWADFSTDDRGGDLVSLFAAIHHLKQIDAARQLSDILGGIIPSPVRSAHVTPIRTPESPEWDGIFPIPEEAPPPPDAHPVHGSPVHVACYRDIDGRAIALVYRCEPTPGDKQVVPLTYCRNTKTGRAAWRWQSLPKPRSLYRAELLKKMRDAPVLLVEGEPKCDLANAHLPDNWIAVSWPNGANSWKQADWSLLAGREVTIWPDADKPGKEAARHIATQLEAHYHAKPCVLDPPDGVPAGWDIKDAITEGWDTGRLMGFISPEPATALWSSDESWEEADIPKRQWLAKGYIERGSVSVVAGAGAAGKSMLFKAWAIAAALGEPFHRFEPVAACRVLSYNVEDDLKEERRRLSASLRFFNAFPSDIAGKIRIIGPNDIGTLIERDQNTGKLKLTDAMIELISHIEQFRPDILMLDPMVELHTSEENDNTALRAVVAQLRTLAVRHKVGLVLAHHVRKGGIVPGDPDMVRGAGAIVGAGRIVFTLCAMSEQDALDLGISKETRKTFFRLDGAKINHAPVEEAEWFERVSHTLANGEDVAAAKPWTPPRDDIHSDTIDSIKQAIAKGIDGDAYTFRAGSPRSLINLCRVHGVNTEAGARQIADAVRAAGFTEQQYQRANRVKAKGIRSPAGGPPVAWDE